MYYHSAKHHVNATPRTVNEKTLSPPKQPTSKLSKKYFEPSYGEQNTTRRFVALIRSDKADAIQTAMQQRPYIFSKLKFYIIDRPQEHIPNDVGTRSIFSEQTELSLSPIGLAIYLKRINSLRLFCTSDVYHHLDAHPFRQCYARNLPHKRKNRIYSIHPLMLALRSEFYEAFPLVMGKDKVDPCDIIKYAVEMTIERPGSNLMKLTRYLMHTSGLQKYSKRRTKNNTQEMVSIFRLFARHAYHKDKGLEHTHQFCAVFKLLLESGYFFKKHNRDCLDLYDKEADLDDKDRQNAFNTDDDVTGYMKWDSENSMVLILGITCKSIKENNYVKNMGSRSRVIEKLLYIITNILEDSNQKDLFQSKDPQTLINYYSSLSENVTLNLEGLKTIRKAIGTLESRRMENASLLEKHRLNRAIDKSKSKKRVTMKHTNRASPLSFYINRVEKAAPTSRATVNHPLYSYQNRNDAIPASVISSCVTELGLKDYDAFTARRTQMSRLGSAFRMDGDVDSVRTHFTEKNVMK